MKKSLKYSAARVLLCDAPDTYKNASDPNDVGEWARKWDYAVVKLKGTSEQFQGLKEIELASQPPRFGNPVYNIGHPLGTSMKISGKSHVLRHALYNGCDSPFAHHIDLGGTYTTDLDQFPGESIFLHQGCFKTKSSSGNSGGPVFDGRTGKVVGHTVSTQSAVSEFTLADIEAWENEYLLHSPNYKKATEIINPYLAQKDPQDPTYRVHSKFHRTLSGNPNGGALFLITTFVCPGDVCPNGVPQRPNTYQAVFNRHRWDSADVSFRNLTGRIDRIYIFTRSLAALIAECKLHFEYTSLASPDAGEMNKTAPAYYCDGVPVTGFKVIVFQDSLYSSSDI